MRKWTGDLRGKAAEAEHKFYPFVTLGRLIRKKGQSKILVKFKKV